MQLDAAQILRQTIASTTFDTAASGAQKADTPVQSGVAMGFGVQVQEDPAAELMDSMEELSFQFEEKEAKDVSERKLGESKRAGNAQIEAIQSWMKMMPDMPGADFLRRIDICFRALLAVDRSERLTIVAHGGTLMAVCTLYVTPARDYFDWQPKNAGGYRLRVVSEEPPALQMELAEEL